MFAARRRKLDGLRADGVEPFPHEFPGVEPIAAVRSQNEGLQAGQETEARHRLAGRLAARRGQGRMAFLDLVDRSSGARAFRPRAYLATSILVIFNLRRPRGVEITTCSPRL